MYSRTVSTGKGYRAQTPRVLVISVRGYHQKKSAKRGNVTKQESAAIGSLLGNRFRIVSELGRGGMATVYQATDEALGRTVAVKLFRSGLTDSEEDLRRRDEVQLLASLNHPGLVTLFDASTDDDGGAYFVMELVDGEDLRIRLGRGPLDSIEAALVGRQLADALAYIHARGVIHRDVKPGNILLPERGIDHSGPLAKLADFGIARIIDNARLTATGMIVGTAGYFSPEQAVGEHVSPQSDIYSLGLVLLEALTGNRAFPGSAAESMAARVTRDPEIDPRLSPEWTALLYRMTARRPELRPSAQEASAELAMLAAHATAADTSAGMRTEAPDATATSEDSSENTEAFSPTKRYPAVATTEAFAGTSSSAESSSSTASSDSRAITTPRPRSSRKRAVMGSVAVLVAAAAIIAAVVFSNLTVAEQPTAPAYPAVEGELGTHLEQLQRSVTP